ITQKLLLTHRVHAVPTKWGDISLVEAESELYKAALKDKSNAYFILLSDTCVPVRSFNYIYNRIKRDERGIVNYRIINNFKSNPSPFITTKQCDYLLKILVYIRIMYTRRISGKF